MTLAESTITVVGATGAVGREMLAILAERGVDPSSVRAAASGRSAGCSIAAGDAKLEVVSLSDEVLSGADVVLFAAPSDLARHWAPRAVAAGAIVVDNSSAFRMDPDVPLVVPEVNGDVLSGPARLIANPNCSTIIMVIAVTPIHRAFGCSRVAVATYQAVSGAGAAGMDALLAQSRETLESGEATPAFFREPCAFNVFSHDSDVDTATGRNTEEEKLIRETRRIWDAANVGITATCMRVPVLRAHTEAINLTLARPAAEIDVRAVLATAPGVRVVDDRAGNDFPTPLKASGRDEVLVGRLRKDPSQAIEGDLAIGFDLIACGDQLRKGAALNAIQIAELALSRRNERLRV